ncbi:MAG TPA: biotin/lipoyl-containing protein, partial [Phycicoccus sp.]
MTTPITRLAVIERGEPAVRLLAAIGNLDVDTGEPPMTRVLVLSEPRERAWYAREADETIQVGGEPTATDDVVAALLEARVDAVWIGGVPCRDQAALVSACEQAGLSVIGPTSDTVRRLATRDGLAAAAEEADLGLLPLGADLTGHRLLEVDVLADSAGTVWAMGPREVTVRRGEHLVLAETPPPGLDEERTAALTEAARRLAGVVGYRGAGVVGFALGPDGTTSLTGVDTLARADHALLEEVTGVSFLGLRIRLARGDLLVHDAPRQDGYAVEARLLAHDPARGFAPSGGTLQVLSLPVGTRVRVDASLHDGDVVDADVDSLIATVTAWGHGRAEALGRLRRALQRTVVVLSGGGSNRCGLLALLARPEVVAGAVTAGWYDGVLASGELAPSPDPLAVVAAAVEAYEADLSLVRSSFFASAERGRPEQPEEVGTQVQLAYRGADYRLRVDRVGPDRYRIHDGVTVEARVDRLGDFQRQVTCGGQRRRVVASELEGAFRLEIDGVAHTVTRVDGLVVRAGWPALVSQVLVEPGQQVHRGEPVAVLESMKMVTTVTAPFDGLVTSVPVVANSQVERGAPLMRIRASRELAAAADLASAEHEQGELDLAVLGVDDATTGTTRCEQVYADLVPYLLGYDRDPVEVRALVRAQRTLSAGRAPDDPLLAACEDDLLDLFADIAALYRPRTEAEELAEDPDWLPGNTQEYFIAYLQWLDADRAGLPDRYRVRLEAALRRYGVSGLGGTRAVQTALLWMFRSFARVPELAPVVTAILERRLAHVGRLRAGAGPDLRNRLARLTRACEGRQQAVADLARDVEFQYFDAPVLDRIVADVAAEMTGHLAALRQDALRADRADRVDRLVWCPQPLRGILLRAWLDGLDDPTLGAYRDCILEVYARRFYRIRDLHGLDHEVVEGRQLAFAKYENEGTGIHLVVAYLPAEDLPAVAHAVATHLRTVPTDREVVVDLVLWRRGERTEIEDLAAEAAGWVDACDFGRPLHRLDLTVTSIVDDDTGALRTQLVTFRQGPEGGPFVEDRLYRNLHPMLGKRLDLWRLSNFDLERLPSPEDVYLFSGVAHENPKDHRLFALAEVRDLVAVRDETTGTVTYPRLGRMGLQALAAMRTALAAYPPKERPVANRLVLSIRPTWDIPSSQLPGLAAAYEPLARGAGLEKLVLHVQVPETDADGRPSLREKVIHVEGIGRSGTSIRLSDPGPNP